jgi:hypothetical protein
VIGETIRTTDVHPFYVDGRGWVNAGELQAGDRVQETDGSWQKVLSTVREGYPGGFTVYNIEVGEHHTYFVEDGFGAVDPVWVHNANECGSGIFGYRWGHGARHLEGTGLNQAEVEDAIKASIDAATKGASIGGRFMGRVTVGVHTVEYRANVMGDDIFVGTYYPL